MLLGLALFYVGAVLCLNGLWLLGQIGDNGIAVIDIFVGGVTLLISLYMAFGPGADLGSVKGAALTLLFTFTYFWVAINRYNGITNLNAVNSSPTGLGQKTTFTATAIGSNISYTWDFGDDGDPVQGSTVEHTFQRSGESRAGGNSC